MIIREFYLEKPNGKKLFKTYSSLGKFIQKVGTSDIYLEAIDIEDSNFEYVEIERDEKNNLNNLMKRLL